MATFHASYEFARHGREMAGQLRDISGYILKRGLPSCGIERVKIYSEKGVPSTSGPGAYAEAFTAEMPLLPCEEEGRLGDPVLRENFIVHVFAFHRWQRLVAGASRRPASSPYTLTTAFYCSRKARARTNAWGGSWPRPERHRWTSSGNATSSSRCRH